MATSSASDPSESRKRKRLSHTDYTIACICPMGVELAPLRALLDTIHEDLPTQRDHIAYTLGELGNHNVVIAVLPGIGNNGSGIAASQIRKDFPSIQLALLVGIGGGVPGCHQWDDIRLGDVVVSQPTDTMGGVIQFDIGKQNGDGNFERIGYLNKPPAFLVATVERLKAQHMQEGSRLYQFVLDMLRRNPGMQRTYSYPGSENDQLFESDYSHIGGDTCQYCENTRTRQRVARLRDEVQVHYGTIGSSNSVIKDATQRDKLREAYGVICVEMEAAGMMDAFPCLVIRGICDYSDSHKNYQWQRFAAATAAAYAKELLLLIPPLGRSDSALPTNSSNRQYALEARAEPVPPLKTDTSRTFVDHERATIENRDKCQQLFDSLTFERMDARLWNIADALRHTCKWVLQDARYKKWLSRTEVENHHGFLWIKGKPGSGKSTMMKEVLKVFKKRHSEEVNLSYFFNARAPGQLEKTSLGMYRLLVYQILESCPHFQDLLSVAFASKRLQSIITWTSTELQGFLNDVVEKLDRPLNIFIDALDEGEEHDIRQLIEFLRSMMLRAFEHQKSLRICLSSRHYPHISIDPGLSVVLEHQDGHKEDIALYIRSNLVRAGGDRMEKLRNEICQKSSQVFLWVVLVIPILNRLYDRGQVLEMERRLKELPPDLDNLFRKILDRDSEEFYTTIALLRWVSFAMRPLSPVELYHATHLGRLQACIDKYDDSFENTVYIRLLHCSRGLTEVTKTKPPTVQFIHETVREFLISGSGLEKILSSGVENIEGICHEDLKTGCLTYLDNYLPLHSDLEGKESPQCRHSADDIQRRYPFAEYAVSYIFSHAEVAQAKNVVQTAFLQTFHEPSSKILLKWVQYRNTFQRHKVRKYTREVYLLYILAEQNLPTLTKALAGLKADVNAKGERYGNALQASCAGGHEQIVRLLLKSGATVNAAGGEHDYAFCAAVHLKHESIALLLLQNGRLPPRDALERLLFVVIARGYLKGVEILLYAGTPIACRNSRGEGLLYFAAMKGRVQIVDLLLKRGGETNFQGMPIGETLRLAMERRLEKAVALSICDAFIQKWGGKNIQDLEVFEALRVAMETRYEEVVELLFANNLVECLDRFLQSQLLIIAVCRKYENAAIQLIEAGADVNAKSDSGESAIHHAVSNGWKKVLQMLLQSGADVNAQGGQFGCPLMVGMLNSSEDIAHLLINHGADMDVLYGREGTPLLQAIYLGKQETAKLLIEKGSDVNAQDLQGKSPIYAAVLERQNDIVQILLQKGADVNAQGGLYDSPIGAAVRSRSEDAVRLLLDSGANVNAVGGLYGCALTLAICESHEGVLKLLIEKGANVNLRTSYMWAGVFVPLEIASDGRKFSIARTLIENGADVSQISRERFRCLKEAGVVRSDGNLTGSVYFGGWHRPACGFNRKTCSPSPLLKDE